MRTWIWRLVIMLLLCGSLAAQDSTAIQDVRQEFANPPKAYRPMVRWWWPGGDVTDAEVRREIGVMDEAGFVGAEIQPFNRQLDPNMSAEARARVNDYLTPHFYSHVAAAIAEAKARGMWIDYTFGSGWPFGGAGVVTPELSSVELRSTQRSVKGPVKFHEVLALPEPQKIGSTEVVNVSDDWKARLKKREKLIAIVAVRGTAAQIAGTDVVTVKKPGQLEAGSMVVLTSRLQPDGTLDWDVPAGEWQIFTFKEIPTAQRAKWVASPPPNFVLDHLSKDAFAVWAQRIGGTAQENIGDTFGNGLRAMFCDSLEVAGYLFWSDDFLAEFQKRRGYDLTPYLPLLKSEGKEEGEQASPESQAEYEMVGIGAKVRADYWSTLSELMMENFYLPYDRWAKEHHLLARVQAHGSPTDLLLNYGGADIPETETLYEKGRDDFMKMASAAGDLYGHRVITSEAFAFPRQAYQVYPEMIKRLADRQLVDGVNEIIYHGFPYEYMDRPEPGWFPFSAGPSFSTALNQHNPFWPFLKPLNEYITRIQYISQKGESVVPVALYRGAAMYNPPSSPPDVPAIDAALMQEGYAFDDINADALLRAKIVDHRLTMPSGFSYRVLVLQNTETLPLAVATQLVAFAKSGLRIVFVGAVPTVEPKVPGGKPDSTGGLEFFAASQAGVFHAQNVAVLAEVMKKAAQPNLQFRSAAVPFLEKQIGKLDFFFLTNQEPEAKTIQADFPVSESPELWDPWTGTTTPIGNFSKGEHSTSVTLSVQSYGSALIVFDPASKLKPAAAASAKPVQSVPIGTSGWQFHGIGIGPGSKPMAVDLHFDKLEEWSASAVLKNFAGLGTYTTSFTISRDALQHHASFTLDLGEVKDAAEVSVNGKPAAMLLMHPFVTDITADLHAGKNTLQITVVNPLYNALSAQGPSLNYGVEETHTANGLLPGGLLGAVVLREQ